MPGRYTNLFAVIAVSVALTTRSFAQSSSAAELYRIAARAVPAPADDAEKFVLTNVLDAPLDDAAKRFVERSAKALNLFEVASRLPLADWGFDSNESLAAGQKIARGSDLASLIILRARQRVAAGQTTAALDDIYNLAQLSRRLSVQPSLARQEQQNALSANFIDAFAMLLPQLAPNDVDDFFKRIDALREPAAPVEVTAAAKQTYLWYYGKLIENRQLRLAAGESTQTLGNLFGPAIQPIDVDDLARDPASATASLAEAQNAFGDMVAALERPSAEREAALEQAIEHHSAGHALVRGAGAIARRSLQLNQEHARKLEMLRIAAAIWADPKARNDGEVARRRAAPYQYETKEGGFEIRSAELTLRVGPRPVRKAPATTQAE
jgi:hypothetical protein